MVESSNLQSAIQRTQAMERAQQYQNLQEDINRRRFELEMARQRAEKAKRVLESAKAESKRVTRDRYDRDTGQETSGEGSRKDRDPEDNPGLGGNLDVRV